MVKLITPCGSKITVNEASVGRYIDAGYKLATKPKGTKATKPKGTK